MGPKIQRVENRSQATDYAENFLDVLNGQVNQAAGAQTVGPQQAGGVGNGEGQRANAIDRLGGVNTLAGVEDHSDQLISAVTAKNAAGFDRQAAEIRESQGILGNRFGSSTSRGIGLAGAENQLNLDQLIASILTDQGARKTQAAQYDANANLGRAGLMANVASTGILPDEIIATPGVGSQLLSAGSNIAAAYLTGGMSLPSMGGGGGKPQPKPKGTPGPRMTGGFEWENMEILDPSIFTELYKGQ